MAKTTKAGETIKIYTLEFKLPITEDEIKEIQRKPKGKVAKNFLSYIKAVCGVTFEKILNPDEKIQTTTVGEILMEEFIKPNKLPLSELALQTDMPEGELTSIIDNSGTITEDIDLKLTKFFKLSKGYFTRLQKDFDKRSKNM
jgi:addiction module HigA family antidote